MALKVKDIVRILKISPATVSLVLNNKPGVSEETRKKVLSLIENNGYDVNGETKPVFKNNGNIRLIVYKKYSSSISKTTDLSAITESPFLSTVMEGIDQIARKNNYNIIVSYIKRDNIKETYKVIEDNPSNGIILLATEMDYNDLSMFTGFNVPIVVIDSYFEKEMLDTVVINNVQGAYMAAEYLINMGHTSIGYLSSSIRINNFKERYTGLIKALKEHNLNFDEKYKITLTPDMEGAYRDMAEILKTGITLPSAFFADNDYIAIGAMRAIKGAGLRVPEDISIIGFDNIPYCEAIDPALTTVKVYRQDMGRLAVWRLLEKINRKAMGFIKIEVGTEIIERKSVAKKF